MVNVFSKILEDFGSIGRAILGFLQSPNDELEIFFYLSWTQEKDL